MTHTKTTQPNSVLFGLDSFGDIPTDSNGTLLSHAAAIRQVVTGLLD
jgi:hypothetical protein